MKPLRVGIAISVSLVLLGVVITLRHPGAYGAPAKATAADFVVSSARDAGPQTLRDAILAADRLSSHAHILITAKLITLDTALPPLVNPRGVDLEAAADSGTWTPPISLPASCSRSTALARRSRDSTS
jgi:hypothetical protein